MYQHTIKPINTKGCKTRQEIRKYIFLTFLEEEPGTGKESNASRFRYLADTTKDGIEIYLTRPTSQGLQQIRGVDFRVDVPRVAFKTTPRRSCTPSHKDIIGDLEKKKAENPLVASQLLEAITRVYQCEEPDEILLLYPNLMFVSGLPVELLLKIIKWLLIEQDVRDWNYSGRGMLMGEITKALS